jgi:hypothetical protein
MRWIQVDVVRFADCPALVEIVVGFSLSKKRSTCERDLLPIYTCQIPLKKRVVSRFLNIRL